MKKTTLTLLLTGLVFSFQARGQQDPQFSHNMFVPAVVNPASVGSNGKLNVAALHRQQWVGFEGAPASTAFLANAGFRLLGLSHGAGIALLDDRLGFDHNFSGRAAYALHLPFLKGKLGIGADFGFMSKSLNASWFIPDADGFVQPGGDPSIPANNTDLVFDMGVGLYYSARKGYLGISTTHLNEADLDLTGQSLPYLRRHYFVTAGYEWLNSASTLRFQPSTFIKYDGAAFQADLNMNVTINDRFWVGASYRLMDDFNTAVALVGMELSNGLRLGYAYDVLSAKTQAYSAGSHEIMLQYSMNLRGEQPPPKYRSVRFL